ncbi:hypothetical protein FOQG_16158 [Fusarium oxysporum f. sp. raphani 54005]|uniref:Uncharacterized protein n=5 Tax=Fusarium oxysporum TaxID=5507 RepID=X0BK16_FUSOX|nr:hypothetical protein FOXG_18090 [Fusarium oxysporum f. sp. lycopersici 4287]EWZ29121.1 hypothetical protein FOZG_17219 [Fusarium oxysporum Fo47]EXK24353.1 hypothetical protein FOMG_18913 [Fusarium oxysporum f. sp. melonis 26406]EXK79208.1 hypothetical protein FOQG_16158 [Fusarium oxysporum f. sp. raphani 54005]EXL66555.1 hypothetical protein FOPG_17269 [Fusarium oxysporum f. sp. conglutinans race 2 54008]KNA96052.1 hypothetical protein FOXG_18090 [Fusarium oxysporum f. sp. lycopersici 4287]
MLFTTVWNWLLEQMGLAYTAKTTNAATYKTSNYYGNRDSHIQEVLGHKWQALIPIE